MLLLKKDKFNNTVLKILDGGLIEESFIRQLNDLTPAQIAFLTEQTDAVLQKNPKHAFALTLASYLHRFGIGKPQDYSQAILLCEQAMDLGCSHAMFNRAEMHKHGQGGPVNLPATIELYEKAIALGDTDAMLSRASMHKQGKGSPVNYPAAIKLYEKAIALGDARAMFHRACMHHYGEGGRIDYRAAIDLYEKAIALGDARAMTNRATLHYKGRGGPVDYPAAIDLYEKAIALGDTRAMNNRAAMHYSGDGGPIDYPAAIKLYEKAIALGYTRAINNRAAMHYSGHGGPVDFPAAFELYKKATALGNDEAMHQLALMYINGEGCPINLIEASKLVRRLKRPDSSIPPVTVQTLLTALKGTLLPTKFTELHYHLSMADQTDSWLLQPLEFLTFLAHDEVVTGAERCRYIEQIIQAFPTIVTQISGQASLDLIGEYYYQQANHVFQKEWLHEPNNNKRQIGLDKAVGLLKQIPTGARRQGDACYDIGYHLYQYYSAIHHSPILGFLKARPYFQRGIALNHTGCLEIFENIVKLVSEQADMHTPITLTALINMQTDGQLGAQLVAIIKSIPLELDFLLYRLPQASSEKDLNFTFWHYDDTQLRACRDALVSQVQHDNRLNNNTHLAFNSDIIKSLAQDYLPHVTKFKEMLPLGFGGQALSDLAEMINAIQEKASAVPSALANI